MKMLFFSLLTVVISMKACTTPYGVVGKSSFDEDVARVLEEQLPISLYYYKGHTGVIRDGLYVVRGDTRNALYSFSAGVIAGAEERELGKVQILKVTESEGAMRAEFCDTVDSGGQDLYIVYTPECIYMLDFPNRKYGKYYRTMQQYAAGLKK